MKALTIGGAVFLLLCADGTRVEAQGVASSFDQLAVLVKPGDKISVVDVTGREAEGRIGTLSRDALTLVTEAGPRALGEGDVAQIRVSSLVSDDLAVGFALVNAGLVLFGLWCHVARVRPGHSSGTVFAWLWTVLEFGNGIGHTALALSQGGYFPGVATAPMLLGMSTYLAVTLSAERS